MSRHFRALYAGNILVVDLNSFCATLAGHPNFLSHDPTIHWAVCCYEGIMGQTNSIVLSLLILIAVVALWFRRSMLDALIEAINNFRGGPPTPT